MVRWGCAAVVAAIVSGFAFLLVTGEYIKEGPTVLTVTRTHGLHAGDVYVVAGWAVAMLAVVVLAAQPGRRRAPEAGAPVGSGR
jgi:hypothetical protein